MVSLRFTYALRSLGFIRVSAFFGYFTIYATLAVLANTTGFSTRSFQFLYSRQCAASAPGETTYRDHKDVDIEFDDGLGFGIDSDEDQSQIPEGHAMPFLDAPSLDQRIPNSQNPVGEGLRRL